ncbi:HNH endonuclease [Pseudomonas sp. H3(2019)]|uniref:HNH endonuclease n=1 Tax=Pseudomonas sp. H3(2019) TaxID=2598724 RepID=UPI0015B4DE43
MKFEPGELDGTRPYFKAIYEKIQEAKDLNRPNAAKLLLKDKGLTPHHHDKVTIQLIPTDLHSNIPHIGSASNMRK